MVLTMKRSPSRPAPPERPPAPAPTRDRAPAPPTGRCAEIYLWNSDTQVYEHIPFGAWIIGPCQKCGTLTAWMTAYDTPPAADADLTCDPCWIATINEIALEEEDPAPLAATG